MLDRRRPAGAGPAPAAWPKAGNRRRRRAPSRFVPAPPVLGGTARPEPPRRRCRNSHFPSTSPRRLRRRPRAGENPQFAGLRGYFPFSSPRRLRRRPGAGENRPSVLPWCCSTTVGQDRSRASRKLGLFPFSCPRRAGAPGRVKMGEDLAVSSADAAFPVVPVSPCFSLVWVPPPGPGTVP